MSVVRKILHAIGLIKDQPTPQCELDIGFEAKAHERIAAVVQNKVKENERAHAVVRETASSDTMIAHASQKAIEELLRQLEGGRQ